MPRDFKMDKMWHIKDAEVRLLKSDSITMEATYYDTPESMIANMHGALRLRRENDRSICCLKILTYNNGPYKKREEFEVETDSILEGLALLPAQGAPADVCNAIVQSGIVVLCNIEFTRNAYRIEVNHRVGNCTAELAVDSGILRGKKQAHFEEIELEYMSGSDDVYHLFATMIESLFSLTPEPQSKIARAMRL